MGRGNFSDLLIQNEMVFNSTEGQVKGGKTPSLGVLPLPPPRHPPERVSAGSAAGPAWTRGGRLRTKRRVWKGTYMV